MRLRSFLTHPRPVHFLVLGLTIYLIVVLWPQAEPQLEAITLGEEQISELRISWLRRTGSYPDAAQMNLLVRDQIDRELLFQEGLRLGLYHGDPVIWRRLIRNMRFAGMEGDDWRLLRQALDLGMHHADIVVRRRIIQVMEERARSLAEEPSEPELHMEYRLRSMEFRRRETSFQHVFLAYDERDPAPLARRLTAMLGGCDKTLFEKPLDAHPAGDKLYRRLDHQILKYFGGEFARLLAQTPPEVCAGPLESAYGLHLVWILERREITPSFDELRSRLREDLLRQSTRQILDRQLHEFRERRGMSG